MSRFSCPIAAILVAGSLGVARLSAQQPREVVVGTLTEDRDGWSLLRSGGSEVAEFMTTRFGPTGVVQDRIFTIRGISAITSDALADIDVFHLVFDSQGGQIPTLTVDEISALMRHTQRGMALLVFVGFPGGKSSG